MTLAIVGQIKLKTINGNILKDSLTYSMVKEDLWINK